MKLLGSLTDYVKSVFKKDGQDITLRPNQTTDYTAGGAVDIQLPDDEVAANNNPGDQVLVGKTANQTLTNKELTAPTLNGGAALTSTSTELNQLSGLTVGGNASGDIVTTDNTQTLTSKTLTSPTLNGPLDGTSLLKDADTTTTDADTIILGGDTSLPTSKAVQNIVGNTVDPVDTTLTNHLNGGASKHDATEIDYDGTTSGLASTNVQDAIDEVDGLVGTNTSNIATNTANIATNTSNTSTNTSNISTNTSNISTLDTNKADKTTTLTAGEGLSGGGDLSSNRTFDLDLNSLVEDSVPATTDYAVFYDVSEGVHNKVQISDLLGAAGGITTLNGLTAATQTFATGTTGSDFNIDSTTSTHTFNIPDASASARGVVTTGTQTFAGAKTFTGATALSNDVTITGDSSSNTSLTITNADNDEAFVIQRTNDANGSGLSFARADGVRRSRIYMNPDQSIGFKVQGGGTEVLTIKDANILLNPNGNVGIGESTPLSKLHVKDGDSGVTAVSSGANELFVESSGDGGITIATPSGNQSSIFFADETGNARGRIRYVNDTMKFTTNNTEAMTIDASSNVGIGTASPGTRLQVGDISGGSNELRVFAGADLGLTLRSSGTTGLIDLVGFYKGNTTLAATIRLNRDTNTAGFISVSDERLKTQLEDFTILDNLNQVEVKQFEYSTSPGHKLYGILAQQASTYLPQGVYEGSTEGPEHEDFKPWAVTYEQMVPLLIKAIQELSAEIEQLKQQLNP